MKEKVIVSACLCGENCKYNGGNNYNEKVMEYIKNKEVILICPEVMGGLSTPRIPCELQKDKIINQQGEDKSAEYHRGAKIALQMALDNHVKTAILKAKSPSCGKGAIYDGTFTHTLVNGDGVCVQYFQTHDIHVYTENDIENMSDMKHIAK